MSPFRRYFEEAGALVKGHFVFNSGVHSDMYVNKDAALVRASHAAAYSEEAVRWILRVAPQAEVIVGPELGAITFMADVRMALWRATGLEIAGVTAHKTLSGGFEIGRDLGRFVHNKYAVVVEDVATSGTSALGAIRAVTAAGGCVAGLIFLWNRGNVPEQTFCVPTYSIVSDTLLSYPPEECPLCKEGIPINEHLGHGTKGKRPSLVSA